MMVRPFRVESRHHGVRDSLDVLIHFTKATQVPDDMRRSVESLMASLTVVGNSGGLADLGVPPKSSRLELISNTSMVDLMQCRFERVTISPRIITLLENLARHVHETLAPIECLELLLPSNTGAAAAYGKFPELCLPLPFEYELDPGSDDIVIDVDFAQPVASAKSRKQFVRLWESWLALAAAGCYEVDATSYRDAFILPDSEPDSDEDQLIFYMAHANISEHALSSLINGFHKLHFQVAPIFAVRIT